MKTVLIVQARMNSSRLKGKILMPLANKVPLIGVLLKRLKKIKNIDKLIVSTSVNSENDILINYLKKNKYDYFRGSENDTLDRYYKTAKKYNADIIVRITADCPLTDPNIIDKFIKIFQLKKPDYLANTFNLDNLKKKYKFLNSYPDGFDVEIFTFKLLAKIKSKHKTKDRKEGAVLGYYLKNNPKFLDSIKIMNMKLPYLVNQKIKLSVDTKKNFILISKIFNHFYPNIYFNIFDVIKFLKIKKKIKDKNTGSKLWVKANKFILGGNMLLSKNPNLFLPHKWPTYYQKSKGINLWDLDGKKYTDMSSMGVGTNILGYSNSQVDNAVKKVIMNGNLTTLNCPEEVELAERLIDLHPWAEKVKFARSGGEANTIAIRLARTTSKNQNVAFCGYHGWHDWYLSSNISEKNNLDKHLIPGLSPLGVHRNLKNTSFPFEYNNLEQLKKIVQKNNIGIIKMEVCRNTNPNVNFLKKIRILCDEKKIILIFDECTSGFRESLGGLHKKINVNPDLAIFGKALGNGYAITAVIGKKDIMSSGKNTFISSTFWTERIGPTAALKTLEIMEKTQSWKKITKLGKVLTNIWKKLGKRHHLNIGISGIPSLARFTIQSKNFLAYKTYITQKMLEKGFLAANVVYMSTSHKLINLKKYEEVLDEIFYEISLCESGVYNIDYLLNYPVCNVPFGRVN
jgi:glutamate-1-semialdehyde 2,1-aminomutase